MVKGLTHEILHRLYAAALEPDLCRKVADLTREMLDVDSAGVFLVEDGLLVGLSVTSDIAESVPAYEAYYQTIDPYSAWRQTMQSSGVYLASEHLDEAQLLGSEFYRDFGSRFGILTPMAAQVTLTGTSSVAVSSNRMSRTRPLDRDDKPTLAAFAPHLRTAFLLNRRHFRDLNFSGWQGEAFEELTFGVIVCDATSRVLYANKVARQAVVPGTGLSFGHKPMKLRADTAAQASALAALVRDCAGGRPGALAITGADRHRTLILAKPLQQGHGSSSRRVFLALHSSHLPAMPTADLLRNLYMLSPAQAALCRDLALGATFEEAAQRRGVAVSTMRTHFRVVLERTGTRNLRDLLQLLAQIPQVSMAGQHVP